jgi:hypothetical protein
MASRRWARADLAAARPQNGVRVASMSSAWRRDGEQGGARMDKPALTTSMAPDHPLHLFSLFFSLSL